MLISGLFLTVLVVVVFAAYREVERTLQEGGADRARHAAEQVAALLGRSTLQAVDRLQEIGPRLRDYLRDPTDARLAEARAALAPLAPGPNRRVTVWNASGARMFDMPESPAPGANGRSVPPPARAPSPGLSPLQAANGRPFTESAAVVNDTPPQDNTILGLISIRSAVSVTPPDTLNRLVGSDARILLGNRSGDPWTDLRQIVAGPTIDLRVDGTKSYRAADGDARIGGLSGLQGTPWVVWVEFPRAAIVARAQRFLFRMSTLALLMAVAMVVVVRWFTIRTIVPLEAMTTAAEAMAAGDYSSRVRADRDDEIGRLGRSFNFMAAEVASVHRQLEERVAERTRALNSALTALSERGRDREAYLATIVDGSGDAIIGTDLDGLVTTWNRGAEKIFGYAAGEMVGTPLLKLVSEERHAEEQHILGSIGRGETVGDFETARRTKSGRLLEVSITASPIKDAAGRIIGVSTVARDITARKQAEAAMRASEGRYRALFDYAPDGILIADGDGTYVDGNPSVCQMLGYTRAELIGLQARDLVVPGDVEPVTPALQTMASQAEFQREWQFRRRDGSVFLAEVITTTMPDGHLVGMVRDVTERRTLEAQYQQAQKMDAIGRLAGGVAHDFNNLLTAILGYCGLLLESFAADDPRRADVTEVQKAGTSAAALTRQLLAFSRKQIIQPSLQDLNAVVLDMREMLERLIGEDVTIVLRLRPEPSLVTADRGQVQQILLNLAVNARDAMPTGGTLTIETANVELDDHYAAAHFAVRPGPYVALTVTDTGAGMPADVQEHLFEPFFTTKEPGKGTGLGLATVHGIVTRSGGSVGVYSEVGKGTSLKVYFPRTVEGEVADDAAPLPATATHDGTYTVLVVEDSDALRELTRRLLHRQGYTVLLAANAADAREVFDQNPSIDVLLTDVVMPGASGPELTKQLVEQRPTLKVIYMSGYTEEAMVHRGVMQSSIAFLHKPFTSEALARTIREVLDSPSPPPDASL